MNPFEIEALFAQTLVGSYDNEAPWQAVDTLRSNDSREIFDRTAEWCESDDPLRRARAADILCQLHRARLPDQSVEETEWIYREESYSLLTKMLENERDRVVLQSAIFALGHLGNDKAVPLILRYLDHSDQNIRFAVTSALDSFPNDPESIAGLLKLTGDPDDEVRDWAVFGLGVLGDTDTPEIREALIRCLGDANEDVYEEAAVGLGKCHDQLVISKLQTMLDEPELSPRARETVAFLLGLDPDDLSEWTTADCKSALTNKFNLQR